MLRKEEMLDIKGGGITSTIINAATRLISQVLDLGKTVGSAIRRISTGKLCRIRQ